MCRSMSTVEHVAEASGRWIAYCQKVDTPAQNAIRQLQANTPGWPYHVANSFCFCICYF